MDEQHPAARVADPRALVGAAPPPRREPFDPAGFLEGRRPAVPPAVTVPAVAVATPLDPATFLGERALRGAFNLSTVKPSVARIGDVEVVTVPLEHYAALLGPTAPLYEVAAKMRRSKALNAEGMLDILLSLKERGLVTDDELVVATGLDMVDLAGCIADREAAKPKPWEGHLEDDGVIHGVTPDGHHRFRLEPLSERGEADPAPVDLTPKAEATFTAPGEVKEAHGAALDDGRETEAHGAAIDAGKPKRHPRRTEPVREIP